MGTLAYYYGPIGCLLLVNASLFLFISVRVRQLRRKTSILSRDAAAPGGAHAHRQGLLYVRIVWLMGVAETAVEMAAWALQGEGYFFHLAAELIDLLRVVAIFVLCVCKRRTWRALRARVGTCTWAESVRASWSAVRSRQPDADRRTSAAAPAEEIKRKSGESTDTRSTVCDPVEAAATVNEHASPPL